MRKLKAFSAVEIIISVAIIAFVVIGVAGVIIGATTGPTNTSLQTKANEILNEGFTAVKSIRDRDFASLLAGEHGVQNTSNQWQLNGSSDIQDGFTRRVNITNVDTNTKQILIQVDWASELGGTKSISSTQIITNYRRSVEIAPPPGLPTTDWSTPQIVGKVNLPADGRDVRLNGNYAYVITTGSNNDFLIFDISNPASPTQVSSLNIVNNPVRMDYANDYVYVTTSNLKEIVVINVANPTNPSLVRQIDLPTGADANGLRVVGEYLYVTRASNSKANSNEVTVLSLSNPGNPTVVGGFNPNQTIYDIEVVGDYAYATSAWNDGEVYILNVSNPAAPTSAGTINLQGNVNGYFIGRTGRYLFVGRTNTNVVIYDILNPTSPQEVAAYTVAGTPQRIIFDTSGQYGFIPNSTNYNADFEVLDLSTITSPNQLDILNNAGTQYSADYDSTQNLIALVGNGVNERLILVKDQVELEPGEDLCMVNYTIQNQWANGFVVDVRINNVSNNEISSWKIEWNFPGDQNIINYWNVNLSQSGQAVIGENLGYNSTIPVGGSQTFGFQATYSGANAALASDQFTVNRVQCIN